VIYCWSHGDASPLPFDEFQRLEILLTILQAFLGWLFLASMSFEAYEAVGLFALWAIQFAFPQLRHEMIWVYSAWIAVEVALLVAGRKRLRAFPAFARSWKERR
jgi:cation:H+ antiporter